MFLFSVKYFSKTSKRFFFAAVQLFYALYANTVQFLARLQDGISIVKVKQCFECP